MEMRLEKMKTSSIQVENGGYIPVTLTTSRGTVECRYYGAEGSKAGAIWVGGAGGGWDTPGQAGLYPRLCEKLLSDGISSLRVKYRYPNQLEECVMDVLAGLTILESQGIEKAAVGGHSFGGAVVIQAGAASEMVKTVVALSTQTNGVGPASTLGPRCSLLLIHGKNDRVLPHRCSEYVYSIAQEPKKLLLYDKTDHGLDEAADEIFGVVREWVAKELAE